MEKTKRKAQALNLRRYWIRYSLLAIVLLIPFRIVGQPLITTIIYGLVFCAVALAIVHFIRKYGWRWWVLILMIVCLILPIGQGLLNIQFNQSGFCATNNDYILDLGYCSSIVENGWICDTDYILIKQIPLGIQLQHRGCWGLFPF